MHTAGHRAERRETGRRPASLAILAALPLALLVGFASLSGILRPAIYSQETPNWAAQTLGQDWSDLLLAVPLISMAGWVARTGSRRASLLLAGGMLYTFYEFVIYGFAIHVNALFLVYCATLGVAFFALAGLALDFVQEDVSSWYHDDAPVRIAGVFLVVVGCVFTVGWLSDVIPALLAATTPRTINEAGLATNPVYVIDLSIVLPLHILAGISVFRRRRLGLVLAPILLTFGAIMALSIAGSIRTLQQRGLPASDAVATGMVGFGAANVLVLALLLHKFRSRPEQKRALSPSPEPPRQPARLTTREPRAIPLTLQRRLPSTSPLGGRRR